LLKELQKRVTNAKKSQSGNGEYNLYDVITTQDMKPQFVLLRFWHLNKKYNILKSPIARARHTGKRI
jgi:hypothetical protein